MTAVDKTLDVVTLGETMALMKAATPGPLSHTESLSLGVARRGE